MPARIALACIVAPSLLLAAPAPGLAKAQPPGGIKAAWIGQDGKDFVGPYPEHKPNGIQDMHVRISGLPPVALKTLVIEGHGYDRWVVQGPPGSWPGHWIRKGKARTAELYLEPFHKETGRAFFLKFEFEDGSKSEVTLKGGKADPILRMPEVTMTAAWGGPSGEDLCGPDLAVGPDGLEDVRIDLARLNPKGEIKAVAIMPKEGPGWEFGLNPKGRPNAELVRDPKDPARAKVLFQTSKDIAGQPLWVHVLYKDDARDRAPVKAGACAIRKPMPKVAVADLPRLDLKAEWKGQGPDGLVRVAIDGLPRGRPVVAALLGDDVRGSWAYKADDQVKLHTDYEALPLQFSREEGDGPKAELAFRPIRGEADTTFTLRLVGKEGGMALAEFPGGACDPDLCAPEPAARTVAAKPGDDLNALARESGTITLAPGTYRLDRPLILPEPVAIVGEEGAKLVFSQQAGSPPWTTAIKIHKGRTRLENFSIRFEGPINWDQGVSYGPAVIGTTDSADPPGSGGLKVGIRLAKLDIDGPDTGQQGKWVEAIRLMRLISADSGAIEGCRLRGGIIEFFRGPWAIRDNVHLGTPPFVWSQVAFAGHFTHDLAMTGNRFDPPEGAGKVWRFLVLTVGGTRDLVAGNEIRGVGPREGDPIPHPNAPETMLTESYRLNFEGKPAGISPDRRILSIPEPPGGPGGVGSAVAILSGEHAGSWHRVRQAIDPRTYWVEPPLPPGDYAISLVGGFVGETFERNTIDARGSTLSVPFVFVGNHFGTKILDNKIFGGAESFRLTAAPTEAPNIWGWSHSPFLGILIRGNTLSGSASGARIGVEHGHYVKTNAGRVYLSAELVDNKLEPGEAKAKREGPPIALRIGDPGGLDPGEMRVTERGTAGPAGLIKRVEGASVNGKAITRRDFPASAPIPGAGQAPR